MKKTEPLDACGVKGCKRPDRPSSVSVVSLEEGSSALQDGSTSVRSAAGLAACAVQTVMLGAGAAGGLERFAEGMACTVEPN